MKNIVKGCLLFVLFFLVLGLFGCENSKVSYKDPTTGEEKQITIEKTENDQEVVDSIYAVALSETPIKSLKTETITIEFSAKLKIKAKDGTIEEVETQGKLTVSAEIGYDENITSLNDLFKASKASVKLEFKGRVPNSEGKQEYFYTSTIELFVEENIVYGKVKLNNKLLSFIEREDEEVGKKLSELNEKVFKYEFDSSIPTSPLSDEMKDTLTKAFGEESGISIKQYLEEDGTSFKDLRAQIEEMVIAYGITITKVSGGEVTYSADLSNLLGKNSTSKINVDVIVNVAEVSFVSAKVSAELNENEATGTVSVEVEVNYKSKVATISASDKEAAVDLMTLLVETNNSIEEPSGDE